MNELQPTESYTREELERNIQSILELMLESHKVWKIEKTEINPNQTEVHVYIFHQNLQFVSCPKCNHVGNCVSKKIEKIWNYLSLFGMRTYIHSKEVWINCPTHANQIISPPWDKQINEQLKLSVL